MSVSATCESEAAARAAAGELVQALLAQGLRLVTAESLTGGMASYLLIDAPDSGEVMAGSVVTYQTDEKARVLGVHDCVVSADCARQMATGAATLFACTCSISVTGVAGPATPEGEPVGTVLIGILADGQDAVLDRHFTGTPDQIRLAAITTGFDAMTELVRGTPCR